jgi:uncharacterized protein YqeY
MTLETIQESIKIAMKTHATLEVETLRSVVAAVKKAAIDRQCEITEALVDEMLLKEVKIIKEQIDTCPDSRAEMKDEYEHRLMIVEAFAPKLITDEAQITTMILNIIAEEEIDLKAAAKNKGLIMKAVMPKIKGKVDMKIANQVISRIKVIQDPDVDIKDGAAPIAVAR